MLGRLGRTKNKAIGSSHGIWFEEARGVLAIRMDAYFYDPEHSEHEDRFILTGVSSRQSLIVQFTDTGDSSVNSHQVE